MSFVNFELLFNSNDFNFFLIAGITANRNSKFQMTNKTFVPVVILPIQDNVKLLKQLKYGFKRTIIWSK